MNEATGIYKARGAKLFFRVVMARAYPRIVGTFRERSWLIFETVLPLLGTSAYVFVYRAIEAPPEYTGFVVVGGAMIAFWLNILWSMAAQLYWDKDLGNLELYIVSPGQMMAILLGMSFGGLVMSGTRAIIVLTIASLMFGVTYDTGNIFMFILIFFLTMSALYGMGMMLASVYLVGGRDAWHILELLQEPIYLVTGFYFPVKSMSLWIAAAASIIPLTLGLDAMRQLLFAGGKALAFLSVNIEALILAVLVFSYLAAAKYALAKMETVGRREGRLVERRR